MDFLTELLTWRYLTKSKPLGTALDLVELLLIYILLWLLTNVVSGRAAAKIATPRLLLATGKRAKGLDAVAEGLRATVNYLLAFSAAFSALKVLRVPTPPLLQTLVFAYLVLRFFLNNIVGRIVVPLVARGSQAQSKERAARIHTLAGVVRSTGNYLLTFIIVLIALKGLGVDITPVLASASVLGLAVGFGSQKLVRDVTTGFFLLAEDQFDVGDLVTVGAVTGVVQEIGMRTTRIRDDMGRLYIVPNGDIALVCNHSMGQVSQFLDVPVAGATDLEKARAVVDAIGSRLESEFADVVLERPRLEGITALTAAQMTLRIRYQADVVLQERVQMRLRELVRETFSAESIALA